MFDISLDLAAVFAQTGEAATCQPKTGDSFTLTIVRRSIRKTSAGSFGFIMCSFLVQEAEIAEIESGDVFTIGGHDYTVDIDPAETGDDFSPELSPAGFWRVTAFRKIRPVYR